MARSVLLWHSSLVILGFEEIQSTRLNEGKQAMTRRIVYVLLIVAITTMLGATATAQDDMEIYVLGVALPFTGSFGTFGQDFERGIDLAVAQMNGELEAAGSAIRFETASADTEQTPEGAARALQTIVQTTARKSSLVP